MNVEITKNDVINVEVFESNWREYLKNPERFIEDVVKAGGCKECAEQYISTKIKVVKESMRLTI